MSVPELELLEYKFQDKLVFRKYRWDRKKSKLVPPIPMGLPKYVDKRRKIAQPPPLE